MLFVGLANLLLALFRAQVVVARGRVMPPWSNPADHLRAVLKILRGTEAKKRREGLVVITLPGGNRSECRRASRRGSCFLLCRSLTGFRAAASHSLPCAARPADPYSSASKHLPAARYRRPWDSKRPSPWSRAEWSGSTGRAAPGADAGEVGGNGMRRLPLGAGVCVKVLARVLALIQQRGVKAVELGSRGGSCGCGALRHRCRGRQNNHQRQTGNIVQHSLS